jgi:hypothetical protein
MDRNRGMKVVLETWGEELSARVSPNTDPVNGVTKQKDEDMVSWINKNPGVFVGLAAAAGAALGR